MDFIFYYFALLAQLAEQLPFKEKVTGSNPVQRTKLDFVIFCGGGSRGLLAQTIHELKFWKIAVIKLAEKFSKNRQKWSCWSVCNLKIILF